jgi:hypothetical protein
VNTDPSSSDDSPPPSRALLAQMVYFEFRSMVMRRLEVTAEWRGLEWTTDAVCTYNDGTANGEACARCPVTGECLAAAIATDDIADWRGGLSRADRECLWAGMERTYRDVCDLELMRTDPLRATRHRHPHRNTKNGQRS